MRSHENPRTESDKHCDKNKANVWAGGTAMILFKSILRFIVLVTRESECKTLGTAKQNRENGNAILTTFSLYRTPPDRKFPCSLNKLKNFIRLYNLRLEISEIETTFLDTVIYKGDRFRNDSILDIRTHYKPTETFQYTHFTHQA